MASANTGSAPRGHDLQVLQGQISTFYRSIAHKKEQASAEGEGEEYSPSQEELRTHISLHIAAMKALLAGDPELNSAYQHCDNFLHTIQKAFEEETARATNAVLANPLAGTTRQGWSDPWGDEGITVPEFASTSPFIGSGSVVSASSDAAKASSGQFRRPRPGESNVCPSSTQRLGDFSQNLSQLQIASHAGRQRPGNAGDGHCDALWSL